MSEPTTQPAQPGKTWWRVTGQFGRHTVTIEIAGAPAISVVDPTAPEQPQRRPSRKRLVPGRVEVVWHDPPLFIGNSTVITVFEKPGVGARQTRWVSSAADGTGLGLGDMPKWLTDVVEQACGHAPLKLPDDTDITPTRGPRTDPPGQSVDAPLPGQREPAAAQQ